MNQPDFPPLAPARVSIAWAVAACVSTLIWQALTVHYNYQGNWTALFQTGQLPEVPPQLQPGTYRFPGTGYDGQMYRYIAHDPIQRKGWDRYMDSSMMRYRRIAVPALAFLLAGGNPPWIDGAYIGVTTLFVFLGSYWLSRWAVLYGFNAAWALAFPLAPATLISVDRLTVDGALTALVVGFAYFSVTKQTVKLYALLVMACLVRETGVLLVVGCVIFEIWKKQYVRSAIWATATLPAVAWYGFLFLNLHATSVATGLPVFVHARWTFGLLSQMIRPMRYNLSAASEAVARLLDSVALFGIVCALIAGIVLMRKLPLSLISVTAFVYTLFGLALATRRYWFDHYGYARVMSPLLMFVVLQAVTLKRPVKSWWWMLIPVTLVDLRVALQLGPQVLGIFKGLSSN